MKEEVQILARKDIVKGEKADMENDRIKTLQMKTNPWN